MTIDKSLKPFVKASSFVYIAAAISAIGGLLFGYDTGVISGAILFVQTDFSLSTNMVEVVVSCVLVGALIGAIGGGVLADRFGRRKVIIATAVVFTLGAIGTALAPTLPWLVFGRVIVGMAIGVASFTTPLYISEISPVRIRGQLVSINQLALTSGIVLAFLADYLLSADHGWRWMFALAAVPALVLGVGMFWLPESPRWLLSKQKKDDARAVLKSIRQPDEVDAELIDIQKGLDAKGVVGVAALFSPQVLPALIIGVCLAIFQQITGVNTVIYYAPMIFGFAGFKSAAVAILATAGVGMVNVFVTGIAVFLVDRVGRRPLLLSGLAGMVIGLGILGLAFQLPQLSGALGWLAIGSLMLYVGSFAIGLGPVFWLLISEIYPLKIRGLAMSVATVANWGANLVVAATFLTLVQEAGRPLTFWLYGLTGLGAWFFVWFLVPETKGQSLEQIEEHLQSGNHPRSIGRSLKPKLK